METIKRLCLLATLALVVTQIKTSAQNTAVNISAQPNWGPAGYNYVSYYYIPAVESYYSINGHRFIYLEDGRWVARPCLPKKHKDFNLFSGYKIVMNNSRPYLNFTNDRIRYSYYKGYKNKQKNLYDKRKLRFATVNNFFKKPGKKHSLKKNEQTDFAADN